MPAERLRKATCDDARLRPAVLPCAPVRRPHGLQPLHNAAYRCSRNRALARVGANLGRRSFGPLHTIVDILLHNTHAH